MRPPAPSARRRPSAAASGPRPAALRLVGCWCWHCLRAAPGRPVRGLENPATIRHEAGLQRAGPPSRGRRHGSLCAACTEGLGHRHTGMRCGHHRLRHAACQHQSCGQRGQQTAPAGGGGQHGPGVICVVCHVESPAGPTAPVFQGCGRLWVQGLGPLQMAQRLKGVQAPSWGWRGAASTGCAALPAACGAWEMGATCAPCSTRGRLPASLRSST